MRVTTEWGLADPTLRTLSLAWCDLGTGVDIVAMSFVGLFIARVLAAYQLGYLDHVGEPFFAGNSERNGTGLIITS
jgi:hypothetical protein